MGIDASKFVLCAILVSIPAKRTNAGIKIVQKIE